ncbi:hypothetical protein B296_00006761 [Ensete ventricosum]|uniref:Uncharacterized protein n=1 Tax=Ensete ventricosum TaxID=4639 RepID=A0A427ANA9_ENSVE|nr:hypothetical protein B296_00006761 [Ensete ventricosum]
MTRCPGPAGHAPSNGAEQLNSPGRSKGSRTGSWKDLVLLGQGSGVTVHRSAAASALTRRLSPVVGGQEALVEGWPGTSALPHVGSGARHRLDVDER